LSRPIDSRKKFDLVYDSYRAWVIEFSWRRDRIFKHLVPIFEEKNMIISNNLILFPQLGGVVGYYQVMAVLHITLPLI
jgi:hypothetical protein